MVEDLPLPAPAPANAGDVRGGFDPWVQKIPWRRAWQPTPVFFPGESHGQRSLAAWEATVHRIAPNYTQLKQLSRHAHSVNMFSFLVLGQVFLWCLAGLGLVL